MDPKKQTEGIPSVRTFAKDLESKRSVVRPKQPTPTPVPDKKPVVLVADEKTDHEYQTPQWTVQKNPSPVGPASSKKFTSPLAAVTKTSSGLPQTTPTAIFSDTEDSAEATIIRDTKKNRFRLIPAIIEALTSWTRKQGEELTAKKVPEFTVQDATDRKDVIQKATSKTGKIVSFDGTSIQQRIRRRKDRAVPSAPATIWTARTEPGFTLLEGQTTVVPTISNVQTFPRKSLLAKTSEKPVVVIPTPPLIRNRASTLSSTPLPSHPTTTVLPPPPPPAVTREYVAPTPPPVTPPPAAPVTAPQPVTATPVVEQPVRAPHPSGFSQLKFTSIRDWLFAIDINAIAIGVTGIIFALLIVGGAGYIWFQNRVAPLELAITPQHETLLEAPLQLITLPEYSRDTLFATINQNAAESTYEVLQLALTTTTSGEVLVPPVTILSTLSIDIDNSLKGSLAKIFFGVVRKTEPVLLLSVTDHTTAQGGMLAWEDTMFTDLAPLFSAAYTAEELASAKFTDTMINATDVRSLTTSRNEEILVYAIVDKHTIIVTRSSATVREIIPLVK